MSIFAALTLASAAAAAHIADIPQPVQFRDWIVVCNNVRHCEAVAARESGDNRNWTLSVVRGAKPSDAPIVSVAPGFDDYSQPARVRIDGQMTDYSLNETGYLESDPVGFLQAIARARSAEVIGPDGNVVGILPVMGATAGLRWIDDQQTRARTVTAIVAQGALPPSTVRTPPPLPRIEQPPISDAPARTIDGEAIEAVREVSECYAPRSQSEFFRLDASHTLGLIACNFGAYQGFSIAVIIDEAGDWALAPIEQARNWPEEYGPPEPWVLSGVTTASFSTERRLLSEFAKGRGLADCGHSASWVWDGEIFRLASYNEMRECRGTPPGDWPSLWVTQNAVLAVEGESGDTQD